MLEIIFLTKNTLSVVALSCIFQVQKSLRAGPMYKRSLKIKFGARPETN